MRFLFFFGVFCLLGPELWSQNLNFARHSHVDKVSGLASINGKNFYMERILSNSVYDSTNLVGINESGKIIFKKHFSINEQNIPQNVHGTHDKSLIVYGMSSSCTASATAVNFIIKADTNGVVQASATSQYMANGALARFIDFAEHPDSSYYFLSETHLFHYSRTLQYVSAITHGLVYAKTMALTNAGTLVIHGKTGSFVAKNIEITTSGTQVNMQNAGLDLMQIKPALSGNFYGLTTSGTIQKYNAALQSAGNSSLSLSPTNIQAFTLRHDSLFFIDLSNTNSPAYCIMNENFTIFSIAASAYNNIYPNAITVNNRNKINIISTATSSMNPYNTCVSFFQFPKNGGFFTTPDVGVASFTITNLLLYPLYSASIPVNLDVTVRNFGNDTVRGFRLNAPGTQLICGYDLFHKTYQNHIPPNGTVIVQTGLFNYPLSGTVTQVPGFLFNNDICIFTTVPDSKNDINTNNDHACKSIALRVGIAEINNGLPHVTVSPNPFDQEFSVESDVQVISVKIYDAYGKLVCEPGLRGNDVKVSAGNLSSGIYLLKIESETGIQIKKIVKQ